MKIYLTLVALCIALSSFAQIEKGRSYLSGQIGGGSSKTSYDNPAGVTGIEKQSSFSLTASYGYLIADSWAVAFSVNGGNSVTKYNNQMKSTDADYSLSPYVRKYFSIGEKFYFHLDGGVNYQIVKSEFKSPTSPITTTDSHAKSTSVFVSPGLSYFLSSRFVLTANLGSLNYNHQKLTGDVPYDNRTKNGFNTSFGLSSIYFGAAIFF